MTKIQRVRVPLGFLFAALYLLFAAPTPVSVLVGGTVSVTGLTIRVWATGHLEKFKGLAVSGPYRYTRNPLYLGSALMGLGISFAGHVWWLVAAYLILYGVVYWPVMRREETELRQAYPDFESYRAAVPLFLPRPGRSFRGSVDSIGTGRRFSWRRVLDNREYNAAIGLVILVLVVLIKMQWWS